MTAVLVIGGGQAGLAAAYALRRSGFKPVILEAGKEAVGSWPRYYDSLALFSPARINSLPGMAFPGDPSHFPVRDEVVDYLRKYAGRLDCEILTGRRVGSVLATEDGYQVETEDGRSYSAPFVVAASGCFDKPYKPDIPGLGEYTGTVLHAADYRNPAPFAGQRVVVVGAANSAVQIAIELARDSQVTLATRKPLNFFNKKPNTGDSFIWSVFGGLGRLPTSRVFPVHSTSNGVGGVVEVGGYRAAIESGRPDRRPMFVGAEGTRLHWADGQAEHVDTVILATGYRWAMDYLRPLGALDRAGVPKQRCGMSTTHPGLAFIGLQGQYSLLSGSLAGTAADAYHIARQLRRQAIGIIKDAKSGKP
ncbi:NAD(P)/FAD-dependent oxidoreductase [Microtetraspora sp. NBRC 13810]|uniref:flavin-containing monooxygenase n=1 Tax=Microtetraspora sp. NBRC 13810 TaxID=3030990 RepID=UPI0025572D9F|nr:NAD(P)/FAD-dependent oxidoreductase [Microtetraspora sp. NBRC 13810]